MKIWDGQKMADLVTHQAKLKKELHDVSDSLHQEYNSDAWGGDDTAAKTEKFSRDQLRHSQLTRELEVCNSDINSLEQFRPSTVKAKKNAALTRFLQRGHNGLEADEIKQQNDYENDDAMVMVGPGYERFVITPETDDFSQAMPGMKPQQSTASDAAIVVMFLHRQLPARRLLMRLNIMVVLLKWLTTFQPVMVVNCACHITMKCRVVG